MRRIHHWAIAKSITTPTNNQTNSQSSPHRTMQAPVSATRSSYIRTLETTNFDVGAMSSVGPTVANYAGNEASSDVITNRISALTLQHLFDEDSSSESDEMSANSASWKHTYDMFKCLGVTATDTLNEAVHEEGKILGPKDNPKSHTKYIDTIEAVEDVQEDTCRNEAGLGDKKRMRWANMKQVRQFRSTSSVSSGDAGAAMEDEQHLV